MSRIRLGFVAMFLLASCGGTPAPASGPQTNVGSVEFLSAQAQPANEAAAMQNQVLNQFNGTVDFNVTLTGAQMVAKILAEHQAGKVDIDVDGDSHGNLVALAHAGALQDMTPLLQRLQRDRQFASQLLTYAKLGTDKVYYIPWIQATYFLVVNKKALPYLPKGADVNSLTYDQLVAWGQNMQNSTGEKKIGLPVAPGSRGGLIKRFVEGYLYPSYTGGEVTGFKSQDAVTGWQMMRKLWAVTNGQSTNYSQMQDPLLSGEVWVAWDHQARLINALATDPNDFVAVPAPSGPKGLGYMSAVNGLAIPVGAPNQKGAEALIDFLTRPALQKTQVAVTGFFPVVNGVNVTGASAAPGVAAEASAATRQQSSKKALPALLPVGLGSHDGDFNLVYVDTFTRILLNNENIQTVLNGEATKLQAVLNAANAPCWPPDPSSSGTCQIT